MINKIYRNQGFKEVTDFLKNIGWWITTAVAFAYFFKSVLADTPSVVIVLLSVFLIYSSVRAYVYRRRYRSICGSFEHLHSINKEIQTTLGTEISYLSSAEESLVDEVADSDKEKASAEVLHKLLQEILDCAARAFKEATSYECTAVLMMPEQSSEDGQHFIGRIYSRNVSNERLATRAPHKGGLIDDAFKSTDVHYYADLKKELHKGNFVKARKKDDNPLSWYRSTVLTSFRVMGEPWGVLCIDSPVENAFRHDVTGLLPIFADACSIAFSAAQHGDFGNIVYVKK